MRCPGWERGQRPQRHRLRAPIAREAESISGLPREQTGFSDRRPPVHCAGLLFPRALLPPPSVTPGTASMPRSLLCSARLRVSVVSGLSTSIQSSLDRGARLRPSTVPVTRPVALGSDRQPIDPASWTSCRARRCRASEPPARTRRRGCRPATCGPPRCGSPGCPLRPRARCRLRSRRRNPTARATSLPAIVLSFPKTMMSSPLRTTRFTLTRLAFASSRRIPTNTFPETALPSTTLRWSPYWSATRIPTYRCRRPGCAG
jgi:hypothetical protein